MKKTKVYIIFGGRSGEHEVSIRSARSVIAAIDTTKYEVIPLCIAKDGTWIKGEEAQYTLSSKKSVLKGLNNETLIPSQISLELHALLTSDIPAVVFPVLHGPYGEDGTIQGMLEMMNVPYVGSGVLGSALGMDKVVQKQVFQYYEFSIVPFLWILKKEWINNRKGIIDEIQKKFSSYPLFIKPVNLGSSVGISKAHNKKELEKAIDKAALYDRKILIEKGLEDIREIEVSVLGNDDPIASVPGEIIPSNEFYDYDAKYINDTSKIIIPAKLPSSVIHKIQTDAISAYQALDCMGFARVDFFVEKETQRIWLNEINTIPGFTSISMYPKLWEASGISYKKLIGKLIELGIERWKEKQQLQTSL